MTAQREGRGILSTIRVVAIGDRFAVPARRATPVIAIVIVGLLGALVIVGLTVGPYGLTLDLVPALLSGDLPFQERYSFQSVRAPKILVAIGAGAAFGLAGALFQTVTRNPLGSPDVIGLTSGAAAGAAAFGLLWPGILPPQIGALLVAGLAVTLVYFGTGTGFRVPSRMIIVGIGISAMSLAFVQYAIARSQRESSTILAAWVYGTLAARDFADAAIVLVALALLLVPTLLLSPRLQLMELGEELSDSLGGEPARTRLLAIILGTLLATAAVTVAGPVAFISLTAPQIARRLSRAGGPNLVLSGLVGAATLLAADAIAQNAPTPVILPVGVITSALGGIYLGFLLVGEWKKGRI